MDPAVTLNEGLQQRRTISEEYFFADFQQPKNAVWLP
jgi:hypothetical protein